MQLYSATINMGTGVKLLLKVSGVLVLVTGIVND